MSNWLQCLAMMDGLIVLIWYYFSPIKRAFFSFVYRGWHHLWEIRLGYKSKSDNVEKLAFCSNHSSRLHIVILLVAHSLHTYRGRFLEDWRFFIYDKLIAGIPEVETLPRCLLHSSLHIVIYKHHVLGLGDICRLFGRLYLIRHLQSLMLFYELLSLFHFSHTRLVYHLCVRLSGQLLLIWLGLDLNPGWS